LTIMDKAHMRENIKIDFKELGSDNVEWIRLAQYRSQWWDLIYLVKYHQVLYAVTNFLTI